MNREQFEKAEKLNKEICRYEDLIGRIKQGFSRKLLADRIERAQQQKTCNDHPEKWTFSRFFKLVFKGEKVIAVPHYDFAQDIEMDADVELIGVIIDYLEKKKKGCETEFERIGDNGL